MTDWTTFIAPALLSWSAACGLYALVAVPLAPWPVKGHRGAERARARKSAGFRLMEWPVRVVAAHIERLGFAVSIARAEQRLIQAGDYLGLVGAELLAMRVVGLVLGLLAAALVAARGFGPAFCGLVVLLGAALGDLSVSAARKERQKQLDRGLPNAIDLAAMSMRAGLDFPGSLAQVVGNLQQRAPLRVELSRILQELSLGTTRRDALRNFASRVPTDAVKEFVAACLQAEEKGTPLAAVLKVQAGSLRGRRSVLAEESAARAGALMIVPLMMLFCCILIIVLGPLILEMNGGM